MIICITENSTHWDEFGQSYLIDTHLLPNGTAFKEFVETCELTSVAVDINDFNLVIPDSYDYCWSHVVFEDIQQAMVQPPQMVDKLLSIVFE